MDIITRDKAKELGLRLYFTGKPCKHGHVCDRYVGGKWCVECRRLWNLANQTSKKRVYEKTNRKKTYANPNVKLAMAIRSRISGAILKGFKKCKSLELLGCEIVDARVHIEMQFEVGMSWDNHGEWHIDHIRPCASFDLTKEEEQKVCFHYTNLRPLWAKENLSKSSYYDGKKHFN